MAGERILVVDDDQGLLTLMKMRLEAAGYMAITAEGAEQALSREQDDPCDVAIVDPKDLLHRIEKAVEVRRLRGEVEQLRTLVRERYDAGNIIAASAKMQYVLRQAAQIAVTDSTVCLYGESGTGKELIGKSIHAMSRRARGPFVAINCGAIPGGLLRQADGGTLFLDEIGELPHALQVKFLRVLQEQEFYPLGAGQPTRVDFRLIAATNQDLWEAVCRGKFREDLYYRIHVIPVVLPPLRERQEDIPLLAHHFLQHFAHAVHKGVMGFSPEAIQLLMVYHWPGNVRELANVVERAVVLATEDLITPDLILLGKQPSQVATSKLMLFKDARAAFERGYLIQVLTAARGNVSRAAELSGRHRAELYRLLRKYSLEPTSFKDIP